MGRRPSWNQSYQPMHKKPNILLINCDDLGYGDLGCYGSPKNHTPHLDALARGGMRLTDFYAASPVCSASRAALLTGCYPQRIGFGYHSVLFPGAAKGLHPEETTLGGQLKKAGYATKIIGKWHCGDQPPFLPTSHGFDDYFGIPYSNDMGVQRRSTPDRPPWECPLPLMRGATVVQEQPDQRGITERYTDAAVQFIDGHREQPFFLYLAHMYVHVPLFVPRQFLDRSKNGAYGGAVECIDWSTGVLVDRLRQHGLLENTLILFTSDNGSRARDEGGSNAPCRGTKATTWEGGQRVPCILHWPGRIPAGSVYTGVTCNIDLFPTINALAGAGELPRLPIDGIDHSAQFLGETETEPNEVMPYYNGHRLEAIRVGEWKLHFAKGAWHEAVAADFKPALYNLREDVGETQNRYAEHPEMVAALEVVAESFRERFGDRLQNRTGSECRPIGEVEHPKTLTHWRADYPYMIASYDLADMPTMQG